MLAVRSRRREDLSAEIEQGHYSSALCHLANIAYRVDRTVKFDPQNGGFVYNEENPLNCHYLIVEQDFILDLYGHLETQL